MKSFLLLVVVIGSGWLASAPAEAQTAADTSVPAILATPSPTPLSAVTAAVPLQRTELYFGGIAVNSWNDFLSDTVTPRFPDGFTWFDSHGQWQTSKGEITKQDSRVLIILHSGSAEKNKLIEEVRELFKTRFHEQSVLRTDASVAASF